MKMKFYQILLTIIDRQSGTKLQNYYIQVLKKNILEQLSNVDKDG